ncbi:MAG: hypothetical protein PVF23_07275 [Chromatiales bacterium]
MPRPLIAQPGSHAWGWLLIAIILTAAILYLGWKLYSLGDTQLVRENRQAVLKLAELEQRLERVSDERDALRQQVASLELSAQVDREAANRLREELASLQDDHLALQGELRLLESVTSGKTPETQLRVSQFTVAKLEQPRQFKYSLTATIMPEQSEPVTATIRMTLSGKRGDKTEELNLLELAGEKSGERVIKFRQLHMIDNEFGLPDGFDPELVKIEINTDMETIESPPQNFLWDAE